MKIKQWFKTPVQQPQADATEEETTLVEIGGKEYTVPKVVADVLVNRGQKQAAQNIVKKAIKIIPESKEDKAHQ